MLIMTQLASGSSRQILYNVSLLNISPSYKRLCVKLLVEILEVTRHGLIRKIQICPISAKTLPSCVSKVYRIPKISMTASDKTTKTTKTTKVAKNCCLKGKGEKDDKTMAWFPSYLIYATMQNNRS